ncbi:hypothetical protein FQR65_LT20632 [Abscondita terminalis]|nr:hypothetical protein FQR65_LT20632 [Abscondita terminalis]
MLLSMNLNYAQTKILYRGDESIFNNSICICVVIDSAHFDQSFDVQFWVNALLNPPKHIYAEVIEPMHLFMEHLEQIFMQALKDLPENQLDHVTLARMYMSFVDALQSELIMVVNKNRDLVVLLTEGRGGRFVRDETGGLRYAPSGREPVVHLGSRRGVPYRSKITSRIVGEPVALEYLGPGCVAARLGRTVDRVLPGAVYGAPGSRVGQLGRVRPAAATGAYGAGLGAGRGRCPGGGGAAGGAAAGVDQARRVDLLELIAAWVPRVSDRFDLDSFDRPLAFAGTWAGAEAVRARGVDDAAVPVAVHQRVRAHIVEDLRQRTNQEHSATQALFMTELYAYLSLAEVPPELWNARSRTRSLPRDWHAYFSYLASGPPAHRLEELVALADAGVVRFLGADLELVADEASGRFHAAGSAATRDGSARSTVVAGALIDAWLPEARAASSDNPLLRALIGSGRARELSVADAGADSGSGDARDREVLTTGQIEVGRDGGLPGSTREFALGPFVAGPYAGAFTRPGLDSLPFRVHDRLARAVLRAAAEVIAGRTAASSHLPAS